jgi:amino acid transporter
MEQALMTAEMSALISDNGGYVVWAQAAFGDYWGWLSGVNGSLANLFDLALYPALVAEYAQEYTSISNTEVGAVTCSP